MAQVREDLITPVDSDVLAALRSLAEREGQQVQTLVTKRLPI
jgi:hypothetical protein